MTKFFNFHLTKGVKYIISINIVIFIITLGIKQINWFYIFGLVPTNFIHNFVLWQLVTYMFLHGGLWHLLINMLMLWFFGCDLESHWGSQRFLRYYFLTGIGAGLCSVLTSFNSFTPVVGASGAIFGILVAYAILFPDTIVLIFFVFPMKVKHAIFIFGTINLLGVLTNPGGDIAYLAHLGGGITGYLYFKVSIFYPVKKFYLNIRQKNIESKKLKDDQLDVRVDEILEKISKRGVNSLTYNERKILRQKSKLLN